MFFTRGLAVLGAAVFLVCSAAAASAQGTPAGSTLLRLEIASVPGVAAFGGTLGAVTANPPQQLSTWDQSDPAGVLGFVNGWYGTPAGPGTATAQVSDPAGSRYAEANWSGVGIRLRSGTGPNVLSIASLHTYARCTMAPLTPSQEAYAANAANALYLFDNVLQPLSDGTQSVSATGAQLGLSNVGNATLRVTVRHVRETGPGWARAKVEVSIDAALYDKSGAMVYDGPLLNATIGDVTVDCGDSPPPTTTTTTTPTTTTTTATTTTTSTTTPGPGPTTTTSGGGGVPVGPDGSGGSGGSGTAGSLPSTGANIGSLVAITALLAIGGGAALVLARRRRKFAGR